MVKRAIDLVFSTAGLVCAAPILIPAVLAIWLQDFHPPFYVADRVGRGGRLFRMVKLRSMVVNAHATGVDSTSANDTRITMVGRMIRACKMDELSQLWNVLVGDMSLVGPRPNVPVEISRYTETEKMLLTVKPGITDVSSIVFSDEGRILASSADPDLDYNRLIRPWKSRLGILYIEHRSTAMDIALMVMTALAIISRRSALYFVDRLPNRIGAPEEVREVARRQTRLLPAAAPGAARPVIAADLYGGRLAA